MENIYNLFITASEYGTTLEGINQTQDIMKVIATFLCLFFMFIISVMLIRLIKNINNKPLILIPLFFILIVSVLLFAHSFHISNQHEKNLILMVDNPSEEKQIELINNKNDFLNITKNESSIAMLEDPSENVQLAAVEKNFYTYNLIQKPTEKTALLALSKSTDNKFSEKINKHLEMFKNNEVVENKVDEYTKSKIKEIKKDVALKKAKDEVEKKFNS